MSIPFRGVMFVCRQAIGEKHEWWKRSATVQDDGTACLFQYTVYLTTPEQSLVNDRADSFLAPMQPHATHLPAHSS